MPEKIDINDEYSAAAKALGVPVGANPDEIEKAFQAQLEQSAGNAQRKEELLHAKGILTGSVQTKEEFGRGRYWTYENRQFKGPDHSERPPTFWERVGRAAKGSLFWFAGPPRDSLQSGKKQFRDPSEIGGSNLTIPERVQRNPEKDRPTRSLSSYFKPGSGGEKRTDNPKRGRSV